VQQLFTSTQLGQTAPVLEILKQPNNHLRPQAQPNTVIQLAPGNYTSETGSLPLVIKQGVTLRGDESTKGKNTVISGGGRYISPTFARQDVTVRAEKDSTITGVTITNANTRHGTVD